MISFVEKAFGVLLIILLAAAGVMGLLIAFILIRQLINFI